LIPVYYYYHDATDYDATGQPNLDVHWDRRVRVGVMARAKIDHLSQHNQNLPVYLSLTSNTHKHFMVVICALG
jgi:hypothetical protein